MFDLIEKIGQTVGVKRVRRSRKRMPGRQVYKQVAVTPEAHAKLRRIADKKDKSIIDTVDLVLGV